MTRLGQSRHGVNPRQVRRACLTSDWPADVRREIAQALFEKVAEIHNRRSTTNRDIDVADRIRRLARKVLDLGDA